MFQHVVRHVSPYLQLPLSSLTEKPRRLMRHGQRGKIEVPSR